MFFFSGNILYFSSSSLSNGNYTSSIKKPVSFNTPIFTQFYFFYCFYFHSFYKEGFFSSELLGKSFSHNNVVLLPNPLFFFSAVTLATSGCTSVIYGKTTVSFLTTHFFVFSNLRLSFYTEVTSRILPLAVFLQLFDAISFLFLPSAVPAAASFDGRAFLKPKILASISELNLRLFFLNFRLFWDIVFFSLCGIHNFFFINCALFLIYSILLLAYCGLRFHFETISLLFYF